MKIELRYEELADQLRCPHGEKGLETGENMFKSNKSMIYNTIDSLNLKSGSYILEIGFGNGKHLDYLFKKENNIYYYGVDISQTMVNEAITYNSLKHTQNRVSFSIIDGQSQYDFQDNYFNVCLSLNTIYFIENPIDFFKEIHRVIKPDGNLFLTFIDKEFAEKIPFLKKGFTFYKKDTIDSFGKKAGFYDIKFKDYNDEVISEDGQKVIRPYFICSMRKQI